MNNTRTCCFPALLLFTFVMTGCGWRHPFQRDLTAWKGHRIDDLVASWGEPDQTRQLGEDYMAYSWLEEKSDCKQTFLVSEGRITGYTSTGCAD